MWTDLAQRPAEPARLAPMLDQLATPAERRLADRAEGWSEGFREATTAAAAAHAAAVAAEAARIDDTRRRCAALVAALEEAVGAWTAAADRLSAASAAEAVEAALAIAEVVVGHELAHTAAPARAAAARALALLPPGAAELRLHPDDAALLGDAPVGDRPVRMVADPTVGRGGCVASTPETTVDARVEAALARVAEVLRSGVPR